MYVCNNLLLHLYNIRIHRRGLKYDKVYIWKFGKDFMKIDNSLLTVNYGIVSDLGHPENLEAAVQKFKDINGSGRGVNAILVLGSMERDFDKMMNSCDILEKSEVRTYLDDSSINEDSSWAIKKHNPNLKFVNQKDRIIMGEDHQIIFVNRYDKNEKNRYAIRNMLGRVNDPLRTIIASHRPVYPANGNPKEGSLAYALEQKGVRKFVSASSQHPFYINKNGNARDTAGKEVCQREKTRDIVYDAGNLGSRKFGILSVYADGLTSYNSLKD